MAENNGDLGPLDCKVCWIRYNTDDRRPRILDCGHTFCTKCLVTSAGKKTLRCPSCRTSYKINSVSSVSININIEDFLESTGLLASPQSTAGICAEHPDYPLFFYCLQHQVWMCYMCKNLNHPDIDSCDVISYENYLLRLKKKGQNIFLNQIEHCNRISEVIERKTNEINYIIDGYNQQIQTLYARIYTLRQSIGVLVNEHSEMARVQHEGKLGCQELRKAHRDLNQTTNLVEMEQTMSNLLYWQQTTQEWMDFTKKCCNIPATLDESEEGMKTKLYMNSSDQQKTCIHDAQKRNNDKKFQILKTKYLKTDNKMNEEHKRFNISVIEDIVNISDGLLLDNSDKPPAVNIMRSVTGPSGLPMISNDQPSNLNNVPQIQMSIFKEMKQIKPGLTANPVTPFTIDITLKVLQKLIPWLLRCRGQIVAVDASSDQQEHEQTNYAEVSELEKKIHLHSLRNYAYQPSPSSIMLPYGKLLRLARDYGALAFLDFNWGSAHGRIYVRLKRNSAQGNQFLQFCTGYDGRTYVGTHLLQIFNKDNPGECIIVGENDPKQPLSASLTNIGYSSNGQYSRPWSPGLVWGGWGTCSTQFGITLRHWTGGLPAPSCFGWIESGLEILQSAVLHPNISQVKVVDCGVVIS
ncbi:uncharacterized protein LOC121870402 isoform X1 [Homarus americanus]|uniref:uncharacterized protein LOC121870402 isoform X1 n=1 Tax=Homarus americanus TaxID=6706 RepID=UPI001C45F9F9|nr:uncharacterized protein LOC121870402 isoform X1 [Homarus americanus]